ncbi:unnamed protein product [Parnassius apollo]|uniref:(apollo) hypothetical protein n=1 Tax=Parnassius apollo TaxID=110799 RepID=A0A8S3XZZ7_PARAO|nr:unnamed protein product [Parnassius apollo]
MDENRHFVKDNEKSPLTELAVGLEEALLASPTPCNSAPQPGTSREEEGTFAAEPQSETNQGGEKKKFARPYKLSGAAGKRYRRLIAAEIGAEEALSLCQKPWDAIPLPKPPPVPKAKKRSRSEEESPKDQPRKTVKLATEEKKLSFSAVAGSMRIGIRNSNPMSVEQMRQVHRALT